MNSYQILNKLCYNSEVLHDLFYRKSLFNNIEESLIRYLYLNNRTTHAGIAFYYGTPVDILDDLSFDISDEVRQNVAENLNSSTNILYRLSDDENCNVRRTLAQNPNAPIDILIKLSKDKDDIVRYSIIKNPNTTNEILKELLNDHCVACKEFALKTLIKKKNMGLFE